MLGSKIPVKSGWPACLAGLGLGLCACWLFAAPKPPPLQPDAAEQPTDKVAAAALQQRSTRLPLLAAIPGDFALALQYEGQQALWQGGPIGSYVHEWSGQRLQQACTRAGGANMFLQQVRLELPPIAKDGREDSTFSDDRQGLFEQFGFALGADALENLGELQLIYQYELLAAMIGSAAEDGRLPGSFDKNAFLQQIVSENTKRLAALPLPPCLMIVKNNHKQTLGWKRLWYDLEHEYFAKLGSLEVEPFEQGGFVGTITCLRMQDLLDFLVDKKIVPLQSIDLKSLKRSWASRKVYLLLAQRGEQFVVMLGANARQLALAKTPADSVVALPQFACLDDKALKKALLAFYASKDTMCKLQQCWGKAEGDGLGKILASKAFLAGCGKPAQAMQAITAVQAALANTAVGAKWDASSLFVWQDRHSFNVEFLPPWQVAQANTQPSVADAALLKNYALYLKLDASSAVMLKSFELYCGYLRMSAALQGSVAAALLPGGKVAEANDKNSALQNALLLESQPAIGKVVSQLQAPYMWLARPTQQGLQASVTAHCGSVEQLGSAWSDLTSAWQQAAQKLAGGAAAYGLPQNFNDSFKLQLDGRELWFYRAAAPFDRQGWNIGLQGGEVSWSSSLVEAKRLYDLQQQPQNNNYAGLLGRVDIVGLCKITALGSYLQQQGNELVSGELDSTCKQLPQLFGDTSGQQLFIDKTISLLDWRLVPSTKLAQGGWWRFSLIGSAKSDHGSNTLLLQAFIAGKRRQPVSRLGELLDSERGED